MTYAGYGNVPGTNTEVSRWIREYIRGETRGLDQTLILIRDGASKWLSTIPVKDRIHHFFVAGGYLGGNTWAVVISNAEPREDWLTLPPLDKFLTTGKRVEIEPIVLVTGIGKWALSPEDLALLNRCARRKPRKPEDYHSLLAAVNRRASRHPRYGQFISERSISAYMPPPGEPISSSVMLHGWQGDKTPAIPFVLMGIDTTEIVQDSLSSLEALEEGAPPPESEEMKRCNEDAGKRSVERKHWKPD
jgi:hypothetical protein